MVAIPCIVCGKPSPRTRCAEHPLPPRARPGYGAEWTALSREMRARQPWCSLCGATGAEVKLVVDHVLPRSLGGTDHPANLRVLCDGCHRAHGLTRASRRLRRG